MSLKVPGRAGACTDMAERQPHHIPDPQRAPHEGDNGFPGLPPTVHERANPPPESRDLPTLPQKSALNRAVERTRTPYERNRWVFLPLGEAGHGSLISPKSQTEQSTQSEGGSRGGPPALDEEMA